MTSTRPTAAQTRASTAIEQLAASRADLADVLAGLMAVVAEEALRNPDFRARLAEATLVNSGTKATIVPEQVEPAPVAVPAKARPKRGRRAAGPWDPYEVYADIGESGLRERLGQLDLEQLRDIVAEHGMNNDGLAMRWKNTDRVAGRIVERVVDRAAKGDAFRNA